jgi:uridine phosphorylase
MKSLLPDFLSDVSKTKFEGEIITNIEMETAAYYAFAASLGHEMISLNAILANRLTHEFSKNPEDQIKQLIELTLDLIA